MMRELTPYWGFRWVGQRYPMFLFAIGLGDWEVFVCRPFVLGMRFTDGYKERGLRLYSPPITDHRYVPDDIRGRWWFHLDESR